MFASFSRTFRSGTSEYPTPRSLILHMITELVGSRRWSWVTFETKPLRRFVEVAHEGDDLIINVGHGFREDYEIVFARQGVSIPDGLRVTEFKKIGWLTGGRMFLTASIHEQERVAEFVDSLFPTLFGEDANYKLKGIYQ